MKLIISGLLLLSMIAVPLPAYACDWVLDPVKCVLEVIEVPIDEAIGEAIDDLEKDVIYPIKKDVTELEKVVKSLPGVLGDIETDVESIIKTA